MTRGTRLAHAVIAALVLLGVCSPAVTSPADAVVNGSEASAADYPFAVALLESDRLAKEGAFQAQFCGGALTTSRTIVTAAHCLVDQKTSRKLAPEEITVGIGHALKSPDLRLVKVSAVAVHPDYGIDTAENDVAVLTLAEAVTDVPVITPMRPTDLRSYIQEGSKVRVAGWGNQSTTGNVFPDHLRVGNLVVFPESACGSNVPFVLAGVEFDGFDPDEANADVMVCAAGVTSAGKIIDACQGDSGSPLIGGEGAATRLVGVVSWGEDCATKHPGVYTRIAAMTDFLVDQQAIATLAPTVAPTIALEPLHQSIRVTFSAAPDGSSVSEFAASAIGPDGTAHQCFTAPRRDRLPASCTITGLVNGTAYNVSAIAANVLGDSPAAAPVSAMPLAVPTAGRITKVQLIPGGFGAFTVKPTTGNGSKVTSVRVVCLPQRGGPGRSAKVINGKAVLSGLKEIRYRCTTVARNAVGSASSDARLVIGRE